MVPTGSSTDGAISAPVAGSSTMMICGIGLMNVCVGVRDADPIKKFGLIGRFNAEKTVAAPWRSCSESEAPEDFTRGHAPLDVSRTAGQNTVGAKRARRSEIQRRCSQTMSE